MTITITAENNSSQVCPLNSSEREQNPNKIRENYDYINNNEKKENTDHIQMLETTKEVKKTSFYIISDILSKPLKQLKNVLFF